MQGTYSAMDRNANPVVNKILDEILEHYPYCTHGPIAVVDYPTEPTQDPHYIARVELQLDRYGERFNFVLNCVLRVTCGIADIVAYISR